MNYNQRRLVNIQFNNLYLSLNEKPNFQKLAKGSETKFDRIYSKYCNCLISQDISNPQDDSAKIEDIYSNKSTSANIIQIAERPHTEQKDRSNSLSNIPQKLNQYVPINSLSTYSPCTRDSLKTSTSIKAVGDNERSIFDIPRSGSESPDSEFKEKLSGKYNSVNNKITKIVKSSKYTRVKVPKIKGLSKIKSTISESKPPKKSQEKLLDHPDLREQFFHFNPQSYFNYQPWMKYQFKLTYDLFRKIEHSSIQPKLNHLTPRKSIPFLKRNLKFTRSSKANTQLFEKFVDDNRSINFGIDGSFKDSSIPNFNLPEKKFRKKNTLIFD